MGVGLRVEVFQGGGPDDDYLGDENNDRGDHCDVLDS